MASKRRQYTQEFKESAVKLVTEQGYKIAEVARNLDININVLRRWKVEAKSKQHQTTEAADLKAELTRLKKENHRLKLEREILKKAATVMALADVKAKQKKKFKVTTNSKHNLPASPNLLNREFNVSEPNRVYVVDITYIWTQEGWLYIAVVIDLFSRKIVDWALNMTRDLVKDALRSAYWCREHNPLDPLIVRLHYLTSQAFSRPA